MRTLLLVFLSAGLFVGCSSSRYDRYGRGYPASARADSQGGQERYYVCHNGRTRTLPEPAVRAHLNHGDRLGACRRDRGRNNGNGRGNNGNGRGNGRGNS